MQPVPLHFHGIHWLHLFIPLCCRAVGGELTTTVTLTSQGGSELSPSSRQMSDPSPASPLVDAVLAAKTQRQHLLLLFQRYGENNQSLTLSGFRKLLKNLVDERLATERRSHHRHGHHQHHNHHHHPHPTASGQSLPCTEARDKRHVTSRNHPANPEDELSEWVKASFTSGEEELECLNASKLLNSHGMDVHTLLGADEFHFICPAIINQIDRRSCLVHAPEEVVTESNVAGESSQNVNSMKIVWLGGFIAITIISVLSLLGVILLPMMNRVFFKFLLSFLVALAVGTLSGDAFLHLLPHSHAKHHHDHDHSHNSSHLEENDHLDATWKGLTALGGLYLMFLVEHVLILVKQYKDKKQKIQKKSEPEEDFEIKKQLSNHSNIDEKCESDSGSHHEVYLQHGDQEEAHAQQPSAPEEEEEEVMIAHSHDETSYQEYVSRGCENKCHSHFHDTLGQSDDMIHHHHDYHHILHHHHHQNHHPHSHSQRYSREELKDAGIATLAWMVIMGDGLHNFGDGLAIGAAFTEGLSSGLSTSVAVFCHELPHELGDFAVLLKSGMTVRQAVLYNGLSAMLAYLGMITGILIGHYAENVSTWIFALTAGLFMYVAFVDMVPEMLHNDASDHGCSRWGYFLLQNAGILLGFSIMLIISVFEHKIVFNLEL